MGLTTLDISAYTARQYDRALNAWSASNDWRDYRRMMVMYGDRVCNAIGRPNGMGAIPWAIRHPNLDDDPISLSNWRVAAEQFGPDSQVAYVRHWASPFEALLIPLTRENVTWAMEAQSALADYPVLCESTWSEVEYELAIEYFDSCGWTDIIRSLDDDNADYFDTLPQHIVDESRDIAFTSFYWDGFGADGSDIDRAVESLTTIIDRVRTADQSLLSMVRVRQDYRSGAIGAYVEYPTNHLRVPLTYESNSARLLQSVTKNQDIVWTPDSGWSDSDGTQS